MEAKSITNYYKLLSSLSVAMDFNSRGVMKHHQRVALIALQIGKLYGLSQVELEKLFTAAILHDAGSSTWEEKNQLCQFSSYATFTHCSKGFKLFKNNKLFNNIAEVVLHHHDRWDGNNNDSGLRGKEIPIESRIIHLADRIDVLLQEDVYVLGQSKKICRLIHKESGKLFDPHLVEAFGDISERECFWLDLHSEFLNEILSHHCPSSSNKSIRFPEVTLVAETMAQVIDHKSPFTHRHSRAVALVAQMIAKLAGLSQDECSNIYIAGLLHDLGKMGVSEAILNKPERLTVQEFALVKRHSYYTYHILKMIDGFDKINHYASCHHETLSGTGYPFRLDGDDLQMGARIVAVADIFSALTEERPYRGALEEEAVTKILYNQAKAGATDSDLTELLINNYDSAMSLISNVTKQGNDIIIGLSDLKTG